MTDYNDPDYVEQDPPDHPNKVVPPEWRNTMSEGFVAVPVPVVLASNLSPQAKTLYMILLYHAWQKKQAWPGIGRMGELLGGLSENSVRRYRKELEQAGLIKTVRRPQGQTNIMYICEVPVASLPAVGGGLDPQKTEDLDPQSAEGEVEEVEVERGSTLNQETSERRLNKQALVAYYYDQAKAMNAYVAPKQAAVLAKMLGEAEQAGASEAMVKAGINVLLSKGLGPSALHSAIAEAKAKKRSPLASVPTSSQFVCMVCGVEKQGPRSLAEHMHNVHDHPHPDDADPGAA